ncbi:ComEA family DNA-binding protein [Nocardia cyriacigeorgica]|uniref:ComEA family DNA-binding protein n=1 Tax=Nocardia cyriacigeorgica TaxID=135487 RepID=UPI0035185F6B
MPTGELQDVDDASAQPRPAAGRYPEGAGGLPDSSGSAAGRWHLDELAPDDPPEGLDDVGEVGAPGWLDEPGRSGGRWRDRLVPPRFRQARMDPGRRGVLTLAGVGLVAAVVAVVVVLWERPVTQQVPPVAAVYTAAPAPPMPSTEGRSVAVPSESASALDDAGGELVVSVVGLVHKSGLVRLPPGSRVADAVAAAGGARDGADLAGINLAQRLSDGDQIIVGSSGGEPGVPRLGSTTIGASGRPPGTAGAATPGPTVGTAEPGTKVNLNSATESDLDALPGIGPVTARAIITWRTTNGRFTDVEQLGDVDGIGPARLARLRDLVTV